MQEFDSIDEAILGNRMYARDNIQRPRMGDFVRFPNGEIERLSHDWDADFQTSPIWAGSFFLHSHGNGGFSGGLNPAIPADSLSLLEEVMEGKFWFFHHNMAGAGRGVYFTAACRVYATSAEYKGFLTRL